MNIDQKLIDEFVHLISNGENMKALSFVDKLIDNNATLEDIFFNLIKNAQYKIGYLWETNKISVANEHMASAIVEGLITHVYSKYERKKVTEKRHFLPAL